MAKPVISFFLTFNWVKINPIRSILFTFYVLLLTFITFAKFYSKNQAIWHTT